MACEICGVMDPTTTFSAGSIGLELCRECCVEYHSKTQRTPSYARAVRAFAKLQLNEGQINHTNPPTIEELTESRLDYARVNLTYTQEAYEIFLAMKKDADA